MINNIPSPPADLHALLPYGMTWAQIVVSRVALYDAAGHLIADVTVPVPVSATVRPSDSEYSGVDAAILRELAERGLPVSGRQLGTALWNDYTVRLRVTLDGLCQHGRVTRSQDDFYSLSDSDPAAVIEQVG